MCSRFNNLCRHARVVMLLMAGWAAEASAVDMMDGKLQLHGFLTQGIVLTSDNNFSGKSDDGPSFDFREVGINASWRPNPDVLVSGQLLSHRVGELDKGNVRLDYAIADWTALSGEWGRGGIRLGRVKHPFGLHNETRDVAFTRPSILLPQSIYFEQARNLEMSSDGAAFYLERYTGLGSFYATYGLGYGQVGDKSVEAAFIGRDFPGSFESNLLQLLNLLWEGDGGRYRLGFTSVWGSMDYDADTGSPMASGKVGFHPVILSAQYNWEQWSLTAEHFLEYIQYQDFGPLKPDGSVVAKSFYVQGTYRPVPRWETFLRYDVFYGNEDDKSGKAFHAATGLPGFMSYSKDWTFGVRYDVTPRFMLRAELHRIEGTGWLSSLENPDPFRLDKRWDMLMLLGSFRF